MSEPVESGPRVVQVEVSRDQAGQRVDNFLIARLKGVPRSRIYRLLRKGEVRVNRGRVRAEYRLEAGDLVHWFNRSTKRALRMRSGHVDAA